jgi:hypothetical protein
MSCIPQSGGCERPFTDTFVSHLNRLQGAQYMHRACLDAIERTTPQPEALYVDAESTLQLVVERKSISWPANYAYWHSNDHAVGDIFFRELRDLTSDDLYELRLPMLMEGKSAALTALAQQATEQIRTNWSAIATGSELEGGVSDKWWWHIRRLPDWDRDEDAPSNGLTIRLEEQGSSFDDFLDPGELPGELSSSIEKIYVNCSGKFRPYLECRRILLLDPHGDLQRESTGWWQSVWANLPPPPQIGEIWSGKFDWVDEETKDWTFEQLYRAPPV